MRIRCFVLASAVSLERFETVMLLLTWNDVADKWVLMHNIKQSRHQG